MDLLIQPDDGLAPLIKSIQGAKKRVEIVIFRCDRAEVEKAMANAVERGVPVHALIASANRNGKRNLRELEMRLLAAGVNVARTADDLVRYHDKLLIVDRRKLHVLAFNFTYLDIRHSRSFGVSTTNRRMVQEAAKLFEADATRRPYTAGLGDFVVSPVNARKQLTALLKGARKQLLIYDPTVSDPAMIRVLEERAAAGVDIRIIGRMPRKRPGLASRKLSEMRLHTRAVLRDGKQAFVGSQSLRALELDARREVGIIFRDPRVVARLTEVFMADWERAEHAGMRDADEDAAPAAKVARRVAKAVAGELPPLAPVLNSAFQEIAGRDGAIRVDPEKLEESVNQAVKDAVKEVVRDVVEDYAGQEDEP